MRALDWLRLPDGCDPAELDSPAAVRRHAEILRRKSLLRAVYRAWYRRLAQSVAEIAPPRVVVELGSGAGFIKQVMPDALATDVREAEGLDLRASATAMPFADGSVDAFVMIDVMHHLPDAAAFLSECRRCLRSGGRVAMIEPANTPLARWVYRRFHHEAFDPTGGWSLNDRGAMAAANGALPWIVFGRDRRQFERQFPELELRRMTPHSPVRYLLSGGLSMRQLAPGWSFPAVAAVEAMLRPLAGLIGMFYYIELRKVGSRG